MSGDKKPTFDLPPDELRRLGALAADAVAAHREGLLAHPVFGKVGARAALFDEPVPEEGRPFEEVLAFAREHILPYPMGNSHPRFYGFINASADPVGIFADFVAAGMNPNCWGGDHAAIHVEDRVMRWIAGMLGYPPEAEGILVSGGSMANFTALAAARRAMTPGNVREEGLAGPDRPRLTVYASDQVHSCVDKAVDLLGIGTNQLRKIPTDDRFRIRMDELARPSPPTGPRDSFPRSSSAMPARSTREPSTRWTRSPISAPASPCGSTPTGPTARSRRSSRN